MAMNDKDNEEANLAEAILADIVERGCEAFTADESEACFYCKNQVNWCAPKHDRDHAPNCSYIAAKRLLGYKED